MSYIDGFIEAFPPAFDDEESMNEATAAHQMQLDILYRIGCQYNVARADMALLCQLANVNVDEFMKHSGSPAAC